MIKKIIPAILIIITFLSGCSMMDAVKDIGKLKFKLHSVTDVKLCGINLDDKKKISDFDLIDLGVLVSAFANNDFPVEMIINIEAKNNSPELMDSDYDDVKIKTFPWKLYLNDNLTAMGNITKPVSVPGKGRTTLMSIDADFDLLQVFRGMGYKKLARLVLGIGKRDASESTKIKITAKPTVETILGDYEYPEEIVLIQKDIK